MGNTKLEICKKCFGKGHVNGGDENSTWSKTCEECHGIGFVRVPMTHADRIRAMSDEELAKFLECFGLCHHCTEHHRLGDVRFYQDEKCDEQCEQHCLEWLQQPAEEGGAGDG